MMQQLSRHELGKFLERFASFDDCLLRKIEIAYERDPSRSVSVWIEARDYEKKAEEVWVCVHLRLRGAWDYYFADQSNVTAEVLSNGLHFLWLDRTIAIDFGSLTDQPENLIELKTSTMFAIGEMLEWQFETYPYTG
jgi:hypothetical protein